MAWIDDLEITDGEGRVQPTRVTAKVRTFRTPDDRPIIQIDTFGSAEREFPGKQSQTLQFGEESAAKLYALLGRTFGFKDQ